MPTIQFKYCLTCGKNVAIQTNCHIIPYSFGEGYDYLECQGPFAECPPPDDLEENWQDNLPALSPGEYYLLQGSRISFDVETDQNIILELI